MQSDIDEQICFTLDIMIDTVELYILILVCETFTFFIGHGSARKQ